jgi:HD-GYP domain-containing protein (c-di-GMP phosphodiesterase class II)
MSLESTAADRVPVLAAAERRRSRVADRERLIEAAFGAACLIAVAAIWVLAGARPGEVELVPALASIACLAVAVHVPFAVGDGYTAPTQLAFVPLMFALPPALIPVGVIAALLLAHLPTVALGRRPASRLLLIPGDAWFAIGPAAVLAAGGAHGTSPDLRLAAAAVAAQVLVETAVWAVREWLQHGPSLRDRLGELWIYGVDLAFTPVALVVAFTMEREPWSVVALVPLLGVLAIFSREREARVASLNELNQAYRGTAIVLGDVVEADDGYTGEHSRGVVALALEVGDALGLDAIRRRNLEFGSLLHDVGKVVIPKEIINKPGRLTSDEWALVKTHTVEGQRMLDRVGGFMCEVGRIVRSHHERWDGAGYPDGLAGDAIPLESRIVCVCDAWNAMTTTRSYRPAMAQAAAAAELRACAGTQFDPRVVAAVLHCVAPSA